ncbi:MAG: hypothetical protein ACR2IE_12150 [Candidatus Sumerlaeaceae bacterium]
MLATTNSGLTFTHTLLTLSPAPPASGNVAIAWDPTVANRFWYRGSGGDPARAYDISGSTATGASGSPNVLQDNVAAPAYGPFDIGPFNGVDSVVLAIGASAATTNGKPVLIADLATLTTDYIIVGTEATGGAAANANASGDVYLDSAANRVYVLYTNNSVSAATLPVANVGDWSLYM